MKKRKQAIVIGLGRFGMSLARALTERGMEVLAADRNEDLVDAVKDEVEDAVVLDASDEDALRLMDPRRRDICVCAIGNESRDGSIVCTALLKQLGAPYVIARATDRIHERILTVVGADRVVNPEDAFGKALAGTIVYENLESQAKLGGNEDLVITEVKATRAMIGKNLKNLRLREKYQVNVVAIRSSDDAQAARAGIPDPERTLREGDSLFIVGNPRATDRMLEGL